MTGKRIIVGPEVTHILGKAFWIHWLPRKDGYVTIPEKRIAEYLRGMFHMKHLGRNLGS